MNKFAFKVSKLIFKYEPILKADDFFHVSYQIMRWKFLLLLTFYAIPNIVKGSLQPQSWHNNSPSSLNSSSWLGYIALQCSHVYEKKMKNIL